MSPPASPPPSSAVVTIAVRLLIMFLGTALRVTTGGKPGQTSLIQIPSSTQFAVVSQGNLLSVGQPRVLQTQLTNQQVEKMFGLYFVTCKWLAIPCYVI